MSETETEDEPIPVEVVGEIEDDPSKDYVLRIEHPDGSLPSAVLEKVTELLKDRYEPRLFVMVGTEEAILSQIPDDLADDLQEYVDGQT